MRLIDYRWKTTLNDPLKLPLLPIILEEHQKFNKKGPLESLRGNVISDSSFLLNIFLCVARNLDKKQTICS